MIIGFNATKDAVYIAETSSDDGQFGIRKITRLQFQLVGAGDLAELLKNVKTLFASLTDEDQGHLALLRCSSGQYGASVEAVKAEAVAELAAHELGFAVTAVKPHGLKSVLGCATGEKWQARSKHLLNPGGVHKYWADGANGAAAAAYKVAHQ